MSTDYGYGHCVHCAPDCHGGEPLVQMHQTIEARPHTGDRAWWDHDDARTCCPACVALRKWHVHRRDKIATSAAVGAYYKVLDEIDRRRLRVKSKAAVRELESLGSAVWLMSCKPMAEYVATVEGVIK
jgi:hypothetical protein